MSLPRIDQHLDKIYTLVSGASVALGLEAVYDNADFSIEFEDTVAFCEIEEEDPEADEELERDYTILIYVLARIGDNYNAARTTVVTIVQGIIDLMRDEDNHVQGFYAPKEISAKYSIVQQPDRYFAGEIRLTSRLG